MHLTEAIDTAADAYWRARLAGLGDRSCFPADLRPAPGAPATNGAATGEYSAELPVALSERLRRLSRNQPATLHVALAAGLVALLGRYTGDEEIVLGAPTLGCPTNPVLVLGCSAAGTFRDVLTRLREEVRSAVRHQDYPVLRLADELGLAAGAAENPYYDVALRVAGLHDEGFAHVPVRMLFTVTETAGAGMVVHVRYDATRFAAASVRCITAHYVRLLELATAEPDRPLVDLELATGEDDRVIRASNATAREFDTAATVHGLFERQAAATPDAPALLTADTTVTFAELDARANRLARTLRGCGVRLDQPVAVLAERSVEMVVAILAVLKAGGAYLPIDPGYPEARIKHLLADSGARLVVAKARFAELAGAVHTVDVDDERSYAPDASRLESAASAGDLAYVIYTSGSTGQPKGVMVEHRSVVNRLAWMQREYPIGPGEVILQKTSISFDVSVWELFWWAFTGAALALLRPGGEKDPAAIVDTVERHAVTTMHFVPSMLGLFLGHVDRFGTAGRLRGLRRVFTSGEALTPGHAGRFAELVPGVKLVNLYGPTEATVDVTHQPSAGADELARVPIGRPIDNIRMHVLDAQRRPLPVGVPGELYVAGVGLARGYLNRDDLTADRFVPGAAVGEDRLYRTGDRARWLPDGSLDFLGRVDQQVKVRGFRIEPAEIEHRLRAHPSVAAAVVVPHDDGWQTVLRAFVVPGPDSAGSDSAGAFAEPEYMVPSRIERVAALPLTPNGKLDRAALTRRSRPARRKPSTPEHVEPRDEREHALAGIWRTVLGVPKVGVHDNFFALGGNSIHFVSVLAAARAAGLDFTFQQLFQHQTIAALAAVLAGEPGPAPRHRTAPESHEPFELLVPADRERVPEGVEDAYPLSMLQAGLIFQTEVTGGLGQYHDVLGYLINGPFEADAFERAVRIMVRRHPILRTTYHLTGFSEFVQFVHEDVRPPMSIIDLRDRTPAEQERFNDEWVAAEKARSFVWREGALVNWHVQVLRDDLYRYTISQHNSALDGWSISLLHTQLFQIYTALREGRTPDEPAGDNHLRNLIALERQALQSPESKRFWLDVLRDAPPTAVSRKPGARDIPDFQVVLRDVPLPPGITERVIALADLLSVPLKDVLLAAHVKVLSLVSGQRLVLTGYEHSGRPELPGAEAALGLFLNTVPLRIDVGDGSWRDLIHAVYQAEVDLLPHRRYPMAQMKHDAAARETLFETTFNYTHFYLLKHLHQLPEFALLDLRVDSETEFVFRTEFSRHFFDDDLRLCLHYHSHLFDQEQIDRIGGYFVRVLELMCGEPEQPHTSWPLLAEADLALLRGGGAVTQPVAYGNLAPQPVEADVTTTAATVDRVAHVWATVLDVPADRLGPDSDFFGLGGNSLSALRVVLELDGMVTLTDLNRHPRLADVARLIDQREQPGHELLHLLSSTAAGGRCALVCVPYPCGHPINFGPLATELEELTSDIVVYGLEQPGHDLSYRGEFTPIDETVRRTITDLVERAPNLPIVLWGHCGGAAVTIELARRLEAAGHDLRHVFIGSKLLPEVPDMRESIEMIEGWTDEQIIRFMVEETGYTDLDGLDAQHTAFMASVFRHDVLGGYRYFIEASQRADRRIEAPLTFVVAADDRGLAHYRDEYERWGLLAADVRLHVLGHGGHYFIRSNAAGTAELIERAWSEVNLT
jgi:amino acid adenylation domain-containing protein